MIRKARKLKQSGVNNLKSVPTRHNETSFGEVWHIFVILDQLDESNKEEFFRWLNVRMAPLQQQSAGP